MPPTRRHTAVVEEGVLKSPHPPRADPRWRRHSPKPRGCPPILTIRHSSPLELVSSRSLGNLQRGELSMVDPQCWAGAPGDGTYRFWVSASITMEM